jgi:hypothetical protein
MHGHSPLRSEQAVAALDIGGGQIVEHGSTFGQVAFGQGLFDAVLPRMLGERPATDAAGDERIAPTSRPR